MGGVGPDQAVVVVLLLPASAPLINSDVCLPSLWFVELLTIHLLDYRASAIISSKLDDVSHTRSCWRKLEHDCHLITASLSFSFAVPAQLPGAVLPFFFPFLFQSLFYLPFLFLQIILFPFCFPSVFPILSLLSHFLPFSCSSSFLSPVLPLLPFHFISFSLSLSPPPSSC